mgnify:CR=1 FL=1
MIQDAENIDPARRGFLRAAAVGVGALATGNFPLKTEQPAQSPVQPTRSTTPSKFAPRDLCKQFTAPLCNEDGTPIHPQTFEDRVKDGGDAPQTGRA